jgi:hypothetical protein
MAGFRVTALALSVLFLFSCGGRGRLKSMPLLDDETITGEYDLILYEEEVDGTRSAFAILDIEGDPYDFVPSAVEGGMSRQRELPAPVAIDRARRFLAPGGASAVAVRRILRDGVTIGFELRPGDDYFDPRPVPNLLRIDYDIDGDKVRFSITVLPLLERSPGR